MNRILTYDLNGNHSCDYAELYKWFGALNAKMLTDSTYEIKSTLSQVEFENKVKSLVQSKHNIHYISVSDNGLFSKKIM